MPARLVCLALLAASVLAGGSAARAKAPDPNKPPSDVEKLTAAIGRHIAQRWADTSTERPISASD